MIHTTQFVVRYAETDMMGVVHHSNYPIWAEQSRTSMMREMGYPYSQVEKDGIMLPVTEIHFSFKNPCYFEDLITIDSSVVHVDNRRLKIAYKIYRSENILCCEGYTKHIFMGVETRKSMRINDDVIDRYRTFYNPNFEKNKQV
ncbi:MAG: acyl-CoA thioesterase [Brevinema sp.]